MRVGFSGGDGIVDGGRLLRAVVGVPLGVVGLPAWVCCWDEECVLALGLRDAKEQMAKMRLFRLTGVVLLAVFALAAVVASSAQAETAPFFNIKGARLEAGKTHNFDARAAASFVMTDASGSSKVTCTGLGTRNGVLLGSAAGTHGSASAVDVFSGCKLEGNGAKCHLAPTEGSAETTQVITTEPIRSELVHNVEGTHGGKVLLEEFVPVSKATGFFKLNFGGECTVKSTIVAGSTVAEPVLDNVSECSIESGQTPAERTAWDLRFPSTPIKEVWLVAGGTGKVVETGEEAFNEESVQTGVALVLLASTKYEPEPNALWSPLP
jgi:hypothetical protein